MKNWHRRATKGQKNRTSICNTKISKNAFEKRKRGTHSSYPLTRCSWSLHQSWSWSLNACNQIPCLEYQSFRNKTYWRQDFLLRGRVSVGESCVAKLVTITWSGYREIMGLGCACTGAEARYALAPPKFFKTSIIVGRNRSHTFSFKSCPPYEKNLALPPICSHKNAPPQIPTFHLLTFPFIL